jgi:cytochrome oxidase Cu insertion factor (SCO1/SenC/PrrC family)
LEGEPMKTIVVLASLILFAQQGKDRPQQGQGPDVGKEAPAWKLKTQDGKADVELAKLKGKPVVLIFGSYT